MFEVGRHVTVVKCSEKIGEGVETAAWDRCRDAARFGVQTSGGEVEEAAD